LKDGKRVIVFVKSFGILSMVKKQDQGNSFIKYESSSGDNMESIGIGVIGCGARIQTVIENLMHATSNVKIRALCDPNPHSISEIKEKFSANVEVYENYEKLIRDTDVDWVFIGSWNCFHKDQILAAFRAGKHVFSEKPLALSVDDCIKIRDAQVKSGCKFVIGFTLRYSPHYRKIKEIVASGKIGKIISMEFNETLDPEHGGFIHSDWRRKKAWAGSHILEKCCHDLDVANWITQSFVLKTATFGGCDFFLEKNSKESSRLSKLKDGACVFKSWCKETIKGTAMTPFNNDKDIVDNQVVILQFANGARATFHTNCLASLNERRMYICGTRGTLRADVIKGTLEVKEIGFDVKTEDYSTGVSGGHGGGDSVLGESLAETMFNGVPPPASMEDALRASITAFGIDSALENGVVFDLDPYWKKVAVGDV
jgi:predicted dehydrogenase